MLSWDYSPAHRVPSVVWVCWTRVEKITRVNAQIFLGSLQTQKPPRALKLQSHHLNILMSPTEKFRPVKCLNAGLYCSLSIINSSAKVFVKLVKVCWTLHTQEVNEHLACLPLNFSNLNETIWEFRHSLIHRADAVFSLHFTSHLRNVLLERAECGEIGRAQNLSRLMLLQWAERINLLNLIYDGYKVCWTFV